MQTCTGKRLCFVLAMLLFSTTFIRAQGIDETYNEKIKEYTTDKRFLPASVLDVPDHPTIPSPRKHFGQIVGTPGIIHRTPEFMPTTRNWPKPRPT